MAHLWLGRQAWSSFREGSSLEWLETNGLGGWAFGTVAGANTRLYHGVLAAAVKPPTERLLLLARLEEVLHHGGRRYPLSTNQWAGGHVEADGLTWLQRFALDPFPTWTYVVGDILLEKRLFMRHGQNSTLVRYRVWCGSGAGSSPRNGKQVTLELNPLVTCRSIHAVLRANDWPFAQERIDRASVSVEPYVGGPRLHMAMDAGLYDASGEWVYGLAYPYEHLRGEPTEEDLYRPGRFWWTCEGDGEVTFIASAEPIEQVEGPVWEEAEQERRAKLLRSAEARAATLPTPAEGPLTPEAPPLSPTEASPASPLAPSPTPMLAPSTPTLAPLTPAEASLVLAADQFIVRRASTGRATVIAGYPWFTDWGRDTMIALPGLTLATGRSDLAREVLQTFALNERDGLLPNLFPEEGGEPMYNTADASLWFFESVWRYLRATGDRTFVLQEIYPVLLRIAAAHIEGTHFDIRVTDDGLLRCGNPNVQVTWMDAKIDDWVVTPRDGKPVEIQAAWYNALRILTTLADLAGDAGLAHRWEERAYAVKQGFVRFWNPSEGCLYDLLHDDGTVDRAIRPNQLVALTLSHPLLAGAKARSTVDVVFRELYTPYGLRSLSPRDPHYRGIYRGTRLERDAAYHQGTVWAWLMGPFIRAYLHAHGRSRRRLQHARALVEPLLAHLSEFGLGSVAEIFDGDPPHLPRGCVAQAWSVAELLRLLREDLVEPRS